MVLPSETLKVQYWGRIKNETAGNESIGHGASLSSAVELDGQAEKDALAVSGIQAACGAGAQLLQARSPTTAL